MRKTILIFLYILLVVFIAFSLLDLKGKYASEKAFWKIVKDYREVSKDPQAVPDATFDKISKRFQEFVKKFPKSEQVPLAYVYSGKVYLLKKDFQKGQKTFEAIAKEYTNSPEIAVQALIEIGRIRALQNDWEGLLRVYEDIQEKYPLTSLGLRAPVLIAKLRTDKKELGQGVKAFNDAILHYQKLIAKYPNSSVGFNALNMLATCYMAQSKWDKALEVFERLLIDYSDQNKYITSNKIETITKTINTISVIELKNYDYPINIYQKFIQKNPNHSYNLVFQKMIDSFKILKEKSVGVLIEEGK